MFISILTAGQSCSYFVLMSIETLGGGLSAQLAPSACAVSGATSRAPTKVWPCGYRAELDMQTLIWANGRGFPLGKLGTRLMCPTCGSRDVNVIINGSDSCERPELGRVG